MQSKNDKVLKKPGLRRILLPFTLVLISLLASLAVLGA